MATDLYHLNERWTHWNNIVRTVYVYDKYERKKVQAYDAMNEIRTQNEWRETDGAGSGWAPFKMNSQFKKYVANSK